LADDASDIAQAALVEPQDRVDGDASNRAQQLTVVSEPRAQLEGERDDELSQGRYRQNGNR
jgi:hypothetical protein